MRDNETKIRAHVVVEGRVQGVFFRESTRRIAHSLGLTGWVRNRSDGCVEALFEGERILVERAVDFVRVGPEFAHVENSAVEYAPYTGEYAAFMIVR